MHRMTPAFYALSVQRLTSEHAYEHIKLSVQKSHIPPELPKSILVINTIFCVWKSCSIYTFHSFMSLVPTQSLSLMFLMLFMSLQ